jgi:5-formyltetrahydrofolate cyclo-ligase
VEKTKKQVRKEILGKLSNQAREEALAKSRTIKTRLFSMPEFKKSKVVMLYASKDSEVRTEKIIDEALGAGKKVALPRCTGLETIVPKEIENRKNDLEKGCFGIREPKKHKRSVQLQEIDLVVVPGVAFDKSRRRLGRGKGFYDKFLKGLPRGTLSVGLAFDFQIVDNLPKDSHDIPVSKVITN